MHLLSGYRCYDHTIPCKYEDAPSSQVDVVLLELIHVAEGLLG